MHTPEPPQIKLFLQNNCGTAAVFLSLSHSPMFYFYFFHTASSTPSSPSFMINYQLSHLSPTVTGYTASWTDQNDHRL